MNKNVYNKLDITTKATICYFISQVIQKCLVFLSIPVFTRILSTDQYGELSTYTNLIEITSILVIFRLDQGVFNKGMSKYKNDRDAYAASMQTLGFLFLLFWLVFAFFSSPLLSKTINLNTELIYLLLIHSFFIGCINIYLLRQRYEHRYISVLIITVTVAVLDIVLGVLFTYYFPEKGVARIVSIAVARVIFGIYCLSVTYKRGRTICNYAYAKFAFFFNRPLFLHYLSLYVLNAADKIMILILKGRTELAFYSVAYGTAMAFQMVIVSINEAMIPWLYEKLELKEFEAIQTRINRLSFCIGICISSFLLLVPEIMRIMAPTDYGDAIRVIPSVTASLLFIFVYQLMGNVEFFYGKTKVSVFISLGSALLNIFLNYLLIPSVGYYIAGVTTLICYFLFSIGHQIYANNLVSHYDNSSIVDWKKASAIYAGLGIVTVIVTWLYDHLIIRLAMIIGFVIVGIVFRNKIQRLLQERPSIEETK